MPTDKMAANPTALLSEADVCNLLGVSRRCLQQWRQRAYGPDFYRISVRCIRYSRESLEQFLNSHRGTHAKSIS